MKKEISKLKEGEKAWVAIDDLQPTQFFVGMREVENIAFNLLKARSKNNLEDKILDRPTQIVLAPEEKAYVIDGHHFTIAAALINEKKVFVEVVKDFSKKTPAEFWQKMSERNWVYPYNKMRKKIPAAQIEKVFEKFSFADLTDDPYRSLAWMVRVSGGYKAIDHPFEEFYWADFFRSKKLIASPRSVIPWIDVLNRALAQAHLEAAKNLPGFTRIKK